MTEFITIDTPKFIKLVALFKEASRHIPEGTALREEMDDLLSELLGKEGA